MTWRHLHADNGHSDVENFKMTSPMHFIKKPKIDVALRRFTHSQQ